jgi:hypothetical protein
MTVVRKMTGAATAAALFAPLALAPAADAGGRRCGGNPEVCFETITTADTRTDPRTGLSFGGSGLELAQVNVYTTNTSQDVRVRAQLFMFKRGVYLHAFKTQEYLLPRAKQNLFSVTPTKVAYCKGPNNGYDTIGGTLPNSSFTTPCHTWKEGYRLGANFFRPDGRSLALLQSDDQTLEIKK